MLVGRRCVGLPSGYLERLVTRPSRNDRSANVDRSASVDRRRRMRVARQMRLHHMATRICGARNRAGLPCSRRSMAGQRRCFNHGGRWNAGSHKRRTKPANAAYAVRLALFRALGIPWHGGRPRKPRKVRTLVEQAKDRLPADIVALSEASAMLPQGSSGQQLAEVALKGLRRLEEIIDMPLDQDNPKQMRLVGDMALGVCKLFQRAAEGAFKAQQGNTLVALLEALKEAQARKTPGG